jgi:hypothetical protein
MKHPKMMIKNQQMIIRRIIIDKPSQIRQITTVLKVAITQGLLKDFSLTIGIGNTWSESKYNLV